MSTTTSTYTIKNFILDISALITDSAVRNILAKRSLNEDTLYVDLSEKERDLAEAEAYFWLSNLPVGGGTTKDVDGSWSHSEGGWQVSGANITEWYNKYTSLREKWSESVISKKPFKIINF